MSELNKEFSTQDFTEQKSVKSFETAKGSIYKLDDEGRTSRFKLVEGKDYPKSGVTVYLPARYDSVVSTLIYHHDDAKVRLLERRSDGKIYRIKNIQDIIDKRNVRLVFMDKSKENETINIKTTQGFKPAIFEVSFDPQLGFHPFELSYDEQYNKTYHYGHSITKIN